ncbi:MAG: RnfABCDGE type electron transport complex subunit G [Treponema sp.]|jgi:electron transport complex protein RnfG|nr:RnfABCDGE type electron transport complex subunit G [Treponema sp.]
MKNIGSMVKLGLVLAVFATAACVMLAFVYTGTKPIIDIQEEANLQKALKDIFPDADSFELATGIVSPDASVTVHSAFKAIRGGRPVGVALRLSKDGYSGPIVMMVGVSAERTITGVKILAQTETPGLGANAVKSSYFVDRAGGLTFPGQFAGKNTSDPFVVKNDIVAITASTITSRAVASSVKAAGIAVTAWFAGDEVDAVSSATEGGAE